ncbi:hypothetical protein [Streptomyces lushanensis]|uniref:hypothetical protein n=1 Tax=Streptomyces lushanensis TaxID=1434255 RepID=UPI000AE61A60|nr:hypothetical protein [Streptomyces lushanensis]
MAEHRHRATGRRSAGRPPGEPAGKESAPDLDPDFGDRPLTEARQDIVIGRWQGVRDLLSATGDDWPRRTHRIRLLAHAAAGSSAVENWRTAEPDSPDVAVLRAATEVVRAFNLAIAAGRGVAVDRERLDATVRVCLRAAEISRADPMPWVSLLTVARLYEDGVSRSELRRWWDELRRRDPYNTEGHTQVLRYFSARWHGTHGRMYDFARDAAGAAPPGSPLPVLVQIARVEEYRYATEGAGGRRAVRDFGQHWRHELAVTEARRTFDRWIGGRPRGPVLPEEVGELNYLTHAVCYAGLDDEAGQLFGLLGPRAAQVPWSYTGDPAEQFTAFRRGRSRAGTLPGARPAKPQAG